MVPKRVPSFLGAFFDFFDLELPLLALDPARLFVFAGILSFLLPTKVTTLIGLFSKLHSF